MRHFQALLYKFIMVTAVMLIVLGFIYGVSFGDILLISSLLTLGAYMLGDLLLLPRFGNTLATIADFGLVLFGTWLLGSVYIEENIRLGVASFLAACLISLCEIFFHRYLVKNVLYEVDDHDARKSNDLTFQTEFSEEQYPKEFIHTPEVAPGMNQPLYPNPQEEQKHRKRD